MKLDSRHLFAFIDLSSEVKVALTGCISVALCWLLGGSARMSDLLTDIVYRMDVRVCYAGFACSTYTVYRFRTSISNKVQGIYNSCNFRDFIILLLYTISIMVFKRKWSYVTYTNNHQLTVDVCRLVRETKRRRKSIDSQHITDCANCIECTYESDPDSFSCDDCLYERDCLCDECYYVEHCLCEYSGEGLSTSLQSCTDSVDSFSLLQVNMKGGWLFL